MKDLKVVSGEQSINREDLSDEFKNVVSLEATSNTKEIFYLVVEYLVLKKEKYRRKW